MRIYRLTLASVSKIYAMKYRDDRLLTEERFLRHGARQFPSCPCFGEITRTQDGYEKMRVRDPEIDFLRNAVPWSKFEVIVPDQKPLRGQQICERLCTLGPFFRSVGYKEMIFSRPEDLLLAHFASRTRMALLPCAPVSLHWANSVSIRSMARRGHAMGAGAFSEIRTRSILRGGGGHCHRRSIGSRANCLVRVLAEQGVVARSPCAKRNSPGTPNPRRSE